MRILIVEDSAAMRAAIRSVVAVAGDEVQECGDGCDALAAFLAFAPDVVLMDIQMAGLDGLGATLQILAAKPTAKVIIVTSYDDDDLRQAAQRAGAQACVLKDNLFEVSRWLRA